MKNFSYDFSEENYNKNKNEFKKKYSSIRNDNHKQKNNMFELDEEYQQKRRKKIIIITIAILISAFLLTIYWFFISGIRVPDFENRPIDEVNVWAARNNIVLQTDEAYSLDIEQGKVIKQEINKGEKIKSGIQFKVTVSTGANPEELIKIPDFSNMNTLDIETWKNKNQATNVRIVKEFNESTPANKYLRMEFKNSKTTIEEYKRKDVLIIYVSNGKEIFEKNIDVLNFIGKSKEEVKDWAEQYDINVTYDESTSNSVERGFVAAQSIAPKEKVAKKDNIIITVSLGKAVVVPDFSSINMIDAQSYQGNGGDTPTVSIIIKEQFHESVPYGTLIYQSINPNFEMSQSDIQPVVLYYSVGKPFIGSLRGKNLKEVEGYFFELRDKNINVSYTIKYIKKNSEEQIKGEVLYTSFENEYINSGDDIIIYVTG